MVYDRANECYYVYMQSSVKKLEVQHEDKEAWKLYIENDKYREAYEICCKYDMSNREYIGSIYADKLFEKKDYKQAAEYYFRVGKNFEEIFLKYLTQASSLKDERIKDGLEDYLFRWLDYYYGAEMLESSKNNEKKVVIKQNKIQMGMLISWIIELKLCRLNKLEAEFNEATQRQIQQEIQMSDMSQTGNIKKQQLLDELNLQKQQFKSFLLRYQPIIDDVMIGLINQQMQSHGRLNDIVELAQDKGAHEIIIGHFINEEKFSEAIKHLSEVNPEE